MFANFGVLNYLTYFFTVMFIVLTPGPNNFFVLQISLSQGIKKAYLAVLGILIGDVFLILITYTGLINCIKEIPFLYDSILYFGVMYLAFLGARILYSTLLDPVITMKNYVQKRNYKILAQALVLNVTNPKAILFYMSFFIQFIDTNMTDPSAAFFILAITLEIVSLIYLSGLIFFGVYILSSLKKNKYIAKIGNILTGFTFIIFAVMLCVLHLK